MMNMCSPYLYVFLEDVPSAMRAFAFLFRKEFSSFDAFDLIVSIEVFTLSPVFDCFRISIINPEVVVDLYELFGRDFVQRW